MSFDPLETSVAYGSRVYLYLFEPDGGVLSFAYTSGSKPITILGHTFEPHPIAHGERHQSSSTEGTTEQMSITVPYDNPVAVMHVPFLPPRPVKVRILAYQRRDEALEVVEEFKGTISNFSQRQETMELFCRPQGDSMGQTVPYAVHKRGCIWNTYEDGCGLNREDWRTDVTVASFGGTTVEATALASKPDGWFTAGYARNPATGEVRFVTEHVGNLVKLNYPFIGLSVGQSLVFYAGDDRSPATCANKFHNKINYVGFDRFPTFNVFIDGAYNGGGGGGSGGYTGPPVGPGENPFLYLT